MELREAVQMAQYPFEGTVTREMCDAFIDYARRAAAFIEDDPIVDSLEWGKTREGLIQEARDAGITGDSP